MFIPFEYWRKLTKSCFYNLASPLFNTLLGLNTDPWLCTPGKLHRLRSICRYTDQITHTGTGHECVNLKADCSLFTKQAPPLSSSQTHGHAPIRVTLTVYSQRSQRLSHSPLLVHTIKKFSSPTLKITNIPQKERFDFPFSVLRGLTKGDMQNLAWSLTSGEKVFKKVSWDV